MSIETITEEPELYKADEKSEERRRFIERFPEIKSIKEVVTS